MHILNQWGFRMVRANGARTIRTILSVAAFFALLTGSGFITDGVARVADASGHGLYQVIEFCVFYGIILITFVMLFSVFSVTVDECRQDEFNLSSAGATRLQIFRSLMNRSLALDLTGAAIGIAVGIPLPRLVLDANTFSLELSHFFTQQKTFVILASGLLVATCTMLLAMLFALIPHGRRPHKSKRWLLRNSPVRRVFGVGGTLGRLSSHKNLRYRAFFTVSFAAVLTVSAILSDTILLLSQIRLNGADADVTLEYMSYYNDDSAQQKVDALLQTCRERGWIESSTVCRSSFLNAGYNCYCLLDSDWLTDEALRAQNKKRLFDVSQSVLPFEQNGKSMQYCPLYNVVFLDDATFARYARENGIDAGTDGTILYCPVWLDKSASSFLKPFESPRDVTLHFLPQSFEYVSSKTQPDDAGGSFDLLEYLTAADKVAMRKTVRLAGSVSRDPYPDGSLSYSFLPEWIVPERLEALFAYMPQQTDPDVPTSKTTVYLRTSAHRDVCDLFQDAFAGDTECDLVKLHFGTGGIRLNPSPARPENANGASALYLEDLQEQRNDLNAFQDLVPKLQALLLLFSTGMLFIGIFNTAHMNRLTRRREKAILESIGMGARQKTGMLLYESVRYALRSTVYALVGFAVYYLIGYRLLPISMYTAHLDMRPDELYHALGVYITPEMVRQSFLQTLGHVWGVFAGGAVLTFLVLVVTDALVDRFYRREELIQILTDDSQFNYQ